MRNEIVKFLRDLILQFNLKILDARKRLFFEKFCSEWPQIEAIIEDQVFFKNVIYSWL